MKKVLATLWGVLALYWSVSLVLYIAGVFEPIWITTAMTMFTTAVFFTVGAIVLWRDI